MKPSDFTYNLPSQLIAQEPLPERSASRLLVLDRNSGSCAHRQFTQLLDFLRPNDLLVFNDTRVIPARLFAQKSSGGKAELLIERQTGARSALAHIRASKSPRDGTQLNLCVTQDAAPGDYVVRVTGRQGSLFVIELESGPDFSSVLNQLGHVPLPPYIERADDVRDLERYQTVYANKDGAVAAPTAGLHFDEALLRAIDQRGIRRATITLHVGAGTFQPVRADNINDHLMHAERVEVSPAACDVVQATQATGGRVIAVGTTAVRALEAASQATGKLQPFCADTDIFIYPGYAFKTVDAMVTNFHLPESTLLMLVSAFAGREAVLAAYAEAISANYRFFSYGDAMFIAPQINLDAGT